MSTEQQLLTRSNSQCELCSASEPLQAYPIPPNSNGSADQSILLCANCRRQIENPEQMDAHHWRCLNDSMWNPQPAVQVMAWRMLTRLRAEGWPQDLLEV
jgi:protein PhnA